VGFGINHVMHDFRTRRKKRLDLVVCTPAHGSPSTGLSFAEQSRQLGITLGHDEAEELQRLPELRLLSVGSVQLALEAKACMTAHIKALPRLYDELDSSHSTIHGAADHAIAAAFVMVNLSDSFISPVRNRFAPAERPHVVTEHNQPRDTERTIDKLEEIPRRTTIPAVGFDALGIVVVLMKNDATPVTLVQEPPAPDAMDPFHYGQMIRRISSLYAQKFTIV
jgi:hypothetical protein